MAGSLNKAIIIGYIGKPPETRTFQDGGKISNFSVATSETWKDKRKGEKVEKTQWHNVCLENEGLVSVAEKYLDKGSKVYIEGKYVSRKYTDQSGVERVIFEIRVGFTGKLIMLSSKESSGSGERSYSRDEELNQDQPLDDEIPF